MSEAFAKKANYGMDSPGPIYKVLSDFDPPPARPHTSSGVSASRRRRGGGGGGGAGAGASAASKRLAAQRKANRFNSSYVPRSDSPGPVYTLPSTVLGATVARFSKGPRFVNPGRC